jgi:hypothetical protein
MARQTTIVNHATRTTVDAGRAVVFPNHLRAPILWKLVRTQGAPTFPYHQW